MTNSKSKGKTPRSWKEAEAHPAIDGIVVIPEQEKKVEDFLSALLESYNNLLIGKSYRPFGGVSTFAP